MLRDIVFAGWARVWWRQWQWWWWRWQWMRVVVALLVWGGTGLALCGYWRVPLLPNVQPAGGDPLQPPHTLQGQNSGYTGSQESNADVEDVRNYRVPVHYIKSGNRQRGHYNTSRLSVINLHASDVNQKHLVNSFNPHKSGLQHHQNSLKYPDNSLTFHNVSLYHPHANLDPLNEVFTISTNDTYKPKDTKDHDNHSDSHHTHKISHKINNNVAKNPLKSANLNSREKGEARQGNKTHATDNVRNLGASEKEVKESDGAPRVILLLTSWRSGSTFMGELLASAVPETFYSYEPLHPWKIRVLEEDDSTTRAALALLKDLFRCRLEPHARQVTYMASSQWYLRWNTRLASQCTAPAKGQQQRSTQEQQKGSQELAREQQGTQGQQGKREQGKQKRILQKRVQGTKEQIEQQTSKQIQQEGTGSLNNGQHHIVNGSLGVQEKTRKNQDPQPETGNHQKHVQAGGKRVQQEPHSPGRKKATPPSCDDASFVSLVCRRSALHVAKVVRLSLRRVVPLMEDPHLPIQVVYLVRDPRAVLSSRSRLPWCVAPACRDPHTVCSSLQQDLHLLPRLLRRYPNRLKMILYEEFLQELPRSLHDLLAFLRLPLSPTHLAFLNASRRAISVHPQEFSNRTSASPPHAQGTYGTSRNLKYQALLWRLNTPYKQASRYQAHCRAALTSLGLRQFTSSLQYHTYSLPALLPRPHRRHT